MNLRKERNKYIQLNTFLNKIEKIFKTLYKVKYINGTKK